MAVKLWSNRIEQFVDGTGIPRSGAKLFTYVGGSVNTKQTTYIESTGVTPNTNPIVLDSAGRIPQPIWLTTGVSYKFVLAPSTDTDPPTSPIDTLDGITGINDSTTVVNEWIAGPAPTFVSASQFTLVGDQTSTFAKSRRIKATVTAGTVYGTIVNTAFGALTTVTVALDSGNLDSGLSAVSYGIVAPVNPSISPDEIYRKGTAVASAATTDIWSIAGDYVHVTGNTGPITSFGTAPYAGAQRTVIFDSTPTITHNATTLQLPSGANITAAAGDRMIVRADTTANMIVVNYIPASGIPLAITGYTFGSIQTFTGTGTWTKPASCRAVVVKVQAPGGGGGGADSDGVGAGAGAGGGGGGYSEKIITAGLGATEAVTIGAVGTAGSATNGTAGGTGGTTSFGAHATATGGGGGSGTGVTVVTSALTFGGGAGGVGSSGTVNASGDAGQIGLSSGGLLVSGNGGAAILGGGAVGRHITAGTLLGGNNGSNYGGGGSGGLIQANTTGAAGGTGGGGIVIVYEFY